MRKQDDNKLFIDVILPEETQDMLGKQLPSLDSINLWKDHINRRLYVNEDISDNLLDYVGYAIKEYNYEDDKNNVPIEQRKPIKIFINSYGGDLAPTMAVLDLMEMSKTPVWTIGEGNNYSSGGLLLIGGHKRFCYKSSTYLLHSGSTGARGSMTQVFDSIEFQKKYEKRVKQFVVDHTKFTSEEYDKNYRVELYLDSEGMLEHGVVDSVLDHII